MTTKTWTVSWTWALSTKGKKKYTQNFGRKILKERDHSEELSIDGDDTKIRGYIYLDKDRDQWRIFKCFSIDGKVLKCRVGFIWTRIGISGGFW
jgi:hypothetical protein